MPVALRVERGPHLGLPRAEILRRARAMCRALQLGDTELSILLTTDDQIRKLNATFRHKDAATDVLAFAMREGKAPGLHGHLLGDVVVSVDTARIQAARADRDILSEVTMLLAHGLLHLLGWDHDTRAKDSRMRAETERLCAAAAPKAARERVTATPPFARGTRAIGAPSRGAVMRPSARRRGARGGRNSQT